MNNEDQNNQELEFVPSGHYFSPSPSIKEIISKENTIWGEMPKEIPGINLNTDGQFDLLDKLEVFYKDIPFEDQKKDGLRYYFDNNAYGYSDAIFLYFMIRYLRPKRVIEVGSGFSSCVILDTNELFFDSKINVSFIEPYPELLKSLIKESDLLNNMLHSSGVQDVPLSFFESLESGDILFIDSTHVSKIGSDVNYIIHKVLPVLASGVHAHFHDIFYPFEYPKEWVIEERRFWNEQYLLRAFLEFNSEYEIVIFNTYLEYLFRSKLEERFPLIFKNPGGSIWIKRK